MASEVTTCRNCDKEIKLHTDEYGRSRWWHLDGKGYRHPCLPKITPDMVKETPVVYIGKKDGETVCRECGKEIIYLPEGMAWVHKFAADALASSHNCFPKEVPDAVFPAALAETPHDREAKMLLGDPQIRTREQADIILYACYPTLVVHGLNDSTAMSAARFIAAAVDRAREAL